MKIIYNKSQLRGKNGWHNTYFINSIYYVSNFIPLPVEKHAQECSLPFNTDDFIAKARQKHYVHLTNTFAAIVLFRLLWILEHVYSCWSFFHAYSIIKYFALIIPASDLDKSKRINFTVLFIKKNIYKHKFSVALLNILILWSIWGKKTKKTCSPLK